MGHLAAFSLMSGKHSTAEARAVWSDQRRGALLERQGFADRGKPFNSDEA